MPCCGVSPDTNTPFTRLFVFVLGLVLSFLALVRPGYGTLAKNAYTYVFKGTNLERRVKCKLTGQLMPRYPRLASYLYKSYEVNFLRASVVGMVVLVVLVHQALLVTF